MKRTIFMLGVIFAIILGAHAAVSADNDTGSIGDNVTWSYNSENTTLTISGTGEMKWTDANWCPQKANVTAVVIVNGVTNIDGKMFSGWAKLASVQIPASVKTIGDNAFYYCQKLEAIIIPEGVESIGNRAFDHCVAVKELSLPQSMASIGDYAFSYCKGITSVTIPNGIKKIGICAFISCTSLTEVTIPEGVESIGERAFAGCSNLQGITIPPTVTSISNGAFSNCTVLTDIAIPDSVTSIGENVLNGTAYYNDEENWENGILYNGNCVISADPDKIEGECIIREGVITIADQVIADCPTITTLTVPAGMTHINDYEFSGCTGLINVIISEGVKSIGEGAFSGCSELENVTIPETVESIGNKAFSRCMSLQNITLPDSTTNVGEFVFLETPFYNNPANWEDGALYSGNCLIEVMFTDDDTEYELKAGTKNIALGAFRGCSKMETLTVPADMTGMGNGTFTPCTELADVYYGSSRTAWAKLKESAGIRDEATVHTVESVEDLTIDTPNTVYTGEEITITVKDGETELTDEQCSIEYENNINAGTASVTITGLETENSETLAKYTGSKTITFEITQATPDYTVPTGLTGTYGKELSQIALPDGWSWKNSAEVIDSVGSIPYTAIFTPADTNYKTVEETVYINVEAPVCSIEYIDGKVVVSTEAAGDYTVIFASYDAQGCLTDISAAVHTLRKGNNDPISPQNFTAGEKVKVMLWNDLNNMLSLCEASGNGN